MVTAKNALVAGESVKRAIGVRTQNVRGQIAQKLTKDCSGALIS